MPEDPAHYTDGQNMRWQLISFNDSDGRTGGVFPISREQFIRIRGIFDYGDDEWFANAYPVAAESWPQLIEVLACPPPEPGNSYFIDGYAADL
ncbi:hypothetical protein GWI34_17520 [Actinomadura sp. DSM 109109]|nr:hypothetical protein [Actinomadura lepetitiana]